MTIKELINLLKDKNQDLTVYVYCMGDIYNEVSSIEEIQGQVINGEIEEKENGYFIEIG